VFSDIKGNTPFHQGHAVAILVIMRHKTGNGRSVKLDQFLEDIKAMVHDGEELLKGGAGEIREKAIAGARSTDRVIRDHPYEILGIVFGLGLIAGLLTAGTIGRRSLMESDE